MRSDTIYNRLTRIIENLSTAEYALIANWSKSNPVGSICSAIAAVRKRYPRYSDEWHWTIGYKLFERLTS